MKTLIKVAFLVFAYMLAFFVSLTLAVSDLGIFGIGIAIGGAVLTSSSPGFRAWLSGQRGYKTRLAKLPGLGNSSPTKQSIAILLYGLPISVICWFLLPFDKIDSAITFAVIGLIELVLFYGWFIYGWKLEKKESDLSLPKFSFTESIAFLKGNKVAARVLALALAMPAICTSTSIAMFSKMKTATSPPVTGVDERLTSSVDELPDEVTDILLTNEDVVSEFVEPRETNTPFPTTTNTPLPTNILRPTATKMNTPTPIPQLEVTTTTANLRGGPGVDYQSIDVLESGDTVTVLARNNDGSWYNVRLDNGTIGWIVASVTKSIHGQTLEIIRVASTIPVPPSPESLQPTQSPQTAVPTVTAPPLPTNTLFPINTQPPPTITAAPSGNCDPAYPDVCIPSPPPDLDCGDIPYRQFRVLPPDPHGFDRDKDGIGCES